MRAALVKLAVERVWPLTLLTYFTLAAVAMLDTGTRAFVLYAFDSHEFASAVYLVAAACSLPTIFNPFVPFFRWVFYIVAGFALTGRMLQYLPGQFGFQEAARDSFVLGALVAHSVIQVDWMIERTHDR